MGMREGQEHPLHAQHLGPGRSEPGETDIGPAVGCANDLDFPPADSPGRLASLERLVDRFLGGEPYGHVGRGVWPALAVGALGRREQALEDARSLVADDGGNAGHFDQIDTDTDRDRKSTRLNSSHLVISYAVFCLKKKKKKNYPTVSRNGSQS